MSKSQILGQAGAGRTPARRDRCKLQLCLTFIAITHHCRRAARALLEPPTVPRARDCRNLCKMDWNLEYGELANDQDFVNKCEDLKENLMELQKVLDRLVPLRAHYDKMSLPAQIELDIFLAFTLNSLYWVQLRIKGVDPTNHPLKNELLRIKAVMVKWQEVKDRDLRPTMNMEAVKRFVRSGLYDPYKNMGQPKAKKTKFKDDSE